MAAPNDSPADPARYRGRIAVALELWKPLVDVGVVAGLSRRGWKMVDPEICPGQVGCDATIRVAGFPEPGPGTNSIPSVTLGASVVHGCLRLGTVCADAAPGEDTQLAHLVETLGRTLDDDAVALALSILPPTLADCPDLPSAAIVPFTTPTEIAPDMRSALELAGIAGDGTSGGEVVAAMGHDPQLWCSLAQGREVIAIGTLPLAGLGLAHHVAAPADIAAIGPALKGCRLNHRDSMRRALATEILFNSAKLGEGLHITAMIDACLRRVVSLPPKSVSIVINNYNYRDYLPAAIASALDQTVAPREVVVVDDGSTDGSRELISETLGIVPVLKANGGQASAFNAGFARTSGDIVLFLDADDRLLPEAVARVGSADFTGVSRLFFGLETIDRHGRSTGRYAPGSPTDPAATGFLAGALGSHGIFPFVPTSGNAFPRKILERVLPMPEPGWRICADLWLFLAVASLGETREIPQVLGQYRIHGQNAHFDDLGRETHAQAAHVARRETAWRDLVSTPPPGMAPAVSQMVRHGLHTALSHAAARRGSRHALRHWPRALREAAMAADLPLRKRAAQALLPLRLATSGVSQERRNPRAVDAVNQLAAGGASGWPRLVSGDMMDLKVPTAAAMLLGHGWAYPDGNGTRLAESIGTLAFRLPELACHWRLRVGFEIEGAAPIRGVRISLNGTEIDTLDLLSDGTMELRLPHHLLIRWDRLLGLGTRDAPLADGAAPAACLTLALVPGDSGRLRLTSLRADALCTTQVHAPCPGVGQFLRLDGASPDARALATLGGGWGWPDLRGAALQGTSAALSFSLPDAGAFALTLLWRAKDSMGERARPADCVMVSLNGALVAGHTAPDGQQITIEIPQRAERPEGRVQIAIMPFPDEATGAWPEPCLTAIRLDRMSAKETTLSERPVLSPNIAKAAGPYVAAQADGGMGLLADGEVARINDDTFRLPVNLPRHAGAVRLHVSFQAPQEPVSVELSIGDERRDVLLCGDGEVVMMLPPGHATSLVLIGRVADPARRCALRSLRLALHPEELSDPAPPMPCCGIDLAKGIGPHQIARLAVSPGDWHAPLEDALWMATHRTELTLPELPDGAGVLTVTVLTMAEAGQSLRIACGATEVETHAAGPQTLRLRLDTADHAPRLIFTSSRLIGSLAVGAGDVGMLGGAVLRIACEAPEDRREPASPRHSSALPVHALTTDDSLKKTDRK